MNWRLARISVAGVASLALFAAGCGSSSSTTSSGTPAATTTAGATSATNASATKTNALAGKTLCISNPVTVDLLTQAWADMNQAAKQSGNGLHIDVTTANGNTSMQLSQASQMVTSGNCSAIAAVPLDGAGWNSVVAAAQKKGIPFFNHSSEVIKGVTEFYALNQYQGGYNVGKVAGQWLNSHNPSAGVGVIDDPSSSGLHARAQGFTTAVKATDPKAQIYTAGEAGADTPSGATAASNLLVAHSNIAVLFGYNDPTGLGAYQAAVSAGHTDPSKFFVSSVDGTTQSIQKIAQGTIYQAVASYWFRYSFPAMERDIERVLLGQTVPKTAVITGNLITKANANAALAALANPFAPANSPSVWCKALGFTNVVATGSEPPPPSQNGCRAAVIPKG
ncbi:MAG TPA: sugar ABC transporter substrate-binding protein [Solirubrobacteraceae bacterium]